jgi:hypothetical protein
MFWNMKKELQKNDFNEIINTIKNGIYTISSIKTKDKDALDELKSLIYKSKQLESVDLSEENLNRLREIKSLLGEINQSRKPFLVYSYAKYINSLLNSTKENKVLSKTDEENTRNTFNVSIRLLESYNRFDHINSRMKKILDEVRERDLKDTDSEYKILSDRYNEYKNDVMILTKEITEFQDTKTINLYVSRISQEKEILSEATMLTTLTFEEAYVLQDELDVQNEERNEEKQNFKKLIEASEKEMPTMHVDELKLDLEKNLVASIILDNEVNTDIELEKVETETLLNSILNLENIVLNLSKEVKKQNEDLLKKIEVGLEVAENVKDEKLILETDGTISSAIDTFINKMNPPQLGAAAHLLRSSIEIWFKYEQIMDFSSDKYKSMHVIQRFEKKFNKDAAKRLHKIWEITNFYIHGNFEQIYGAFKDDKKKEKDFFIQSADFLDSINLNIDDPGKAISELMVNDYKYMKSKFDKVKIKDGRFDLSDQLTRSVFYFFKNQGVRSKYLEHLGKKVPKLDYYTSIDLIKHLNALPKKKIASE